MNVVLEISKRRKRCEGNMGWTLLFLSVQMRDGREALEVKLEKFFDWVQGFVSVLWTLEASAA
jgi:hypothetical protein